MQQVKFSPHEGGNFVAEHNTIPAEDLEDTKRLHLNDSNRISEGTCWQDSNIIISLGQA